MMQNDVLGKFFFEKNEIYGKMLEAKFFFSQDIHELENLNSKNGPTTTTTTKLPLKENVFFASAEIEKCVRKRVGISLHVSGLLGPIFNKVHPQLLSKTLLLINLLISVTHFH